MKAEIINPLIDETRKGLPRPLGYDKKTLRPIAWNMDDSFGVADSKRQEICGIRGWCQVCGDLVKTGIVYEIQNYVGEAFPKNEPKKDVYTLADLRKGPRRILDEGPLHKKCAMITRAHCRTVRVMLKADEIKEIRYAR